MCTKFYAVQTKVNIAVLQESGGGGPYAIASTEPFQIDPNSNFDLEDPCCASFSVSNTLSRSIAQSISRANYGCFSQGAASTMCEV